MKKLILLCGALLTFARPTFAAENCKAVRWPLSQKIDTLKLAELKVLPRDAVYAYLFFELSAKPEKRIPGLAEKLMKFLEATELNKNKNYMVQGLEEAADLSGAKNVIPLNDICEFEKKALAAKAD